MYEKKHQPILPAPAFQRRLLNRGMLVLWATGFSLAIGVLGYHITESLSWLDAFLNAAMILGGMGPVDTLHTSAGKFFAACYALYSGFFLIVCGGLLLAPVFHRILHHFHEQG
jgi:hypothetical protein